MNQNSAIHECFKLLEKHGGSIAEKSNSIMVNDSTLKDLKKPFEFISRNWRDPLTPSLIALSCEAVGGNPKDTYDTALGISLINLSFFLWDDIIDQSYSKIFKPTLSGKYGSSIALISGGMVSAKAFSIINKIQFNQTKKNAINQLIWNLLSVMTKVEVRSLEMRNQGTCSSKDKLWKIKTESIDTETCLRIGAIIGEGSKSEVDNLGRYGASLGMILGLINDFRVALNLTLELVDKIKLKTLPYSLLLACEISETLKKRLDTLLDKKNIDSASVKLIVKDILETSVFVDIQKKVDFLVQEANVSLQCLKENRATIALRSFIELQPKFFVESIPII